MKSRKIIIGLIMINIILIGMLCNVIYKNRSIIKEKQIIKEMNESTQITELNNQITALNAEHTEYMNYIQTCKTKIATALTNEGVPTSDQVTLETMAGSISNVLQERTKDATAIAEDIAEGKTAYVNGELITGTNNNDVTLEVKSVSYSAPFTITGLKKGDLIHTSISNNYWDRIIYMYINNISGAEVISQQINDTTGSSNATLYLRATSSTVQFTIGCDSRYPSWNPAQIIIVKHI